MFHKISLIYTFTATNKKVKQEKQTMSTTKEIDKAESQLQGEEQESGEKDFFELSGTSNVELEMNDAEQELEMAPELKSKKQQYNIPTNESENNKTFSKVQLPPDRDNIATSNIIEDNIATAEGNLFNLAFLL